MAQTVGVTGFFRPLRWKRRFSLAPLASGIVGFLCGVVALASVGGGGASEEAAVRTNLRQALHMAQMRSATLSSEAASARAQSARLEAENDRLHAHLTSLRRTHRSLVANLETWSSRFVEEAERGVTATGLHLEELVESHRRDRSGHRGGPFLPLSGQLHHQAQQALPPALAKALELESVVSKLPWRLPLGGAIRISSGFGARSDPFTHRAADHTGLDLPAPRGRPVLATAPGIVTAAGPEGDYGILVEVEHEGGLSTRYAHLDSVDVEPGAAVADGQTIGYVGSTGRSTGPHLHYEVRANGRPLDPAKFIAAGERLAALGNSR